MVFSQGNILIVDDEETIRWLLSKKLSREGYLCKESSNAEQAMEKMGDSAVELAILDINMPGKSGTELLTEIKANFPKTSVIMASAVSDTKVILQCLKNGAEDYIRKPFSMDEVILSIKRTFHKKRIEAQIEEYCRSLKDDSLKQETEIQKFFLKTIESLVSTLESNDKYTAGHSRRVTDISIAIGEEMGLPNEEIQELRWGALLHDVGKIAVDPNILNKSDELTPAEYRHIMTHSVVGPDIVKPVVNNRIIDIISHHHDHYDGSGFGQVVATDDIPAGARILAIADAYDAMTSDRPYRTKMSRDAAVQEIVRHMGSQFDPDVVRAFLRIPPEKIINQSEKPTVAIDPNIGKKLKPSPKSTSAAMVESNLY